MENEKFVLKKNFVLKMMHPPLPDNFAYVNVVTPFSAAEMIAELSFATDNLANQVEEITLLGQVASKGIQQQEVLTVSTALELVFIPLQSSKLLRSLHIHHILFRKVSWVGKEN